jgi:hypothetical protein
VGRGLRGARRPERLLLALDGRALDAQRTSVKKEPVAHEACDPQGHPLRRPDAVTVSALAASVASVKKEPIGNSQNVGPERQPRRATPRDYSQGTMREAFIAVLEKSPPDVQAKIVRGVVEKYPAGGSELRSRRRVDIPLKKGCQGEGSF